MPIIKDYTLIGATRSPTRSADIFKQQDVTKANLITQLVSWAPSYGASVAMKTATCLHNTTLFYHSFASENFFYVL